MKDNKTQKEVTKMSVKPITPTEVSTQFALRPLIPDFVIETINDLLCRRCCNPEEPIQIYDYDIADGIERRDPHKDYDVSQLHNERLPDLKSLYKEAGWDVKYITEHGRTGTDYSHFIFAAINE